MLFFVSCSEIAFADLIAADFGGVVSGNSITGHLTYESDATDNFDTLQSFSVTVGGNTYVADSTLYWSQVDNGSCCSGTATRDFIDIAGVFSSIPELGVVNNSVGITFFDVGATPDTVNGLIRPTTQAEFDAFPNGYNNGHSIPGGRRMFYWDPGFQQDTLDSFTIVPEPSTFLLAALGFLGLGMVRRRRRR